MSSCTMSATLPLEVLRVVFELVDSKGTLITLLLVSRPVSALVEPLLYKNVMLSGMPSPAFRARSDGFHRRLAAEEGRLALCVEALTTSVSTSLASYNDRTYSYLDDILPRLRYLRRLKLLYHWESTISFPTPSAPYYPFALTHFASYNRFKQPDDFVMFLESQPSLEHLVISLFDESVLLAPHALPNLRVLEAPLKFALSVLPGRSIAHLILGTSSDVAITYDREVQEALRSLQSLSCTARDIPTLSPWLRNVRYLWLSLGKVGLLEDFIAYSTELQTLHFQYLRLSGFRPAKHHSDVIETFFDEHPSLLLIDIKRVPACEYYRYRPRQSTPTKLEMALSTWDEWWCT